MPRNKIVAALAYFADKRIAVMLALGFSSGLPNLLVFDTLSAWLREAGLSLEVIGFFSLATLAYSFKFLWAPLVDRTRLPLFTGRLGHRRSWMLLCQIAVMIGLWLVAGSNPARNLGLVAAFAVFTGFASATQDIVIDAWRIEAAEEERQGAMAAAYQWGYRVATIVAGAAPLLIAQHFGWPLSYGLMAILMAVGILAVVLAPPERSHTLRHVPTAGLAQRPWLERGEWLARLAVIVLGALVLGSGLTGKASLLGALTNPFLGASERNGVVAAFADKTSGPWCQLLAVFVGLALVALAAFPVAKTRPGAYLGHAFGEPLQDFFSRFGRSAAPILALICVYRLSEFVLNIMNPFYIDAGFTLTEIAEVRKLFGVIASVGGVFIGGLAVARLGLIRSLVLGAFAQPVSHAGFIWLAIHGHNVGDLFIAIGLDNAASGFAGTCLIAYMSGLTSEGFTATQYALFSSLYSLPGKLIASQSGRIVEASARSAAEGGALGWMHPFFSGLSPGAYAAGAQKLGVSAQALASGYVAFFLYSGLIGLLGIALVFFVASGHAGTAPTPQPKPARS